MIDSGLEVRHMIARLVSLVFVCLVSSLSFAQNVETQVLVPIELRDTKEFVRLVGEINDQSVSQFIADLTVAAAESDTVTVFIDSPGGDVLAGIRAIDSVFGLKVNKPSLTLSCYAHSAASMAFTIFELSCNKRIVSQYSILMQHQASLGMRGKWGEVQSRAELVGQVITLLEGKLAARLGLSLTDFQARVVNDWWLVGKTAIKNNAADILGVVSCSAELVKAKQCPLVYAPSSSEDTRSRGPSAPSEGQTNNPQPKK